MAKILLTEVDKDLRFNLVRVLNEAGHKVESLNEGSRIVNDQVEIPDLFILDQKTPTIDGLALSKFLKINSKTKHVPIIMISTDPEARKKAKRIGVNDFLEKPLESKNLLKVVNRLFIRI